MPQSTNYRKLRQWYLDNPDGWMLHSHVDIAKIVGGMSDGAVDQNMKRILYEEEGMSPADYMKQRADLFPRGKSIALAVQDKIVELHKTGHSLDDIIVRTGRSRNTIIRYIKKYKELNDGEETKTQTGDRA